MFSSKSAPIIVGVFFFGGGGERGRKLSAPYAEKAGRTGFATSATVKPHLFLMGSVVVDGICGRFWRVLVVVIDGLVVVG